MTLYPNVVKKAQTELDAVVGLHRLPTFEDADRLPYLQAVHREVLRWAPVTPFGTSRSYDAATQEADSGFRWASSFNAG